jgi:hypothetical protein
MAVSPSWASSLAEEVARIYEAAELRILERIAAVLASGITDPWWERDVLQRLQTLRPQVLATLQQANPEAARAILAALEEAYAVGTLGAFRDVGSQEVPIVHQAAVEALAAATVGKVGEGMPRILRAADDVAGQVIQKVLGGTVTGSLLRRDALQQALNGLARAGLQGVQVGRGTMGLADYARMAVRTGTAQAMVEGHTAGIQSLGLDLCTIQPGPRACNICDDWAGKVLAISGPSGTVQVTNEGPTGPKTLTIRVDGTLAEARSAGWGHPNCRCSVAAFIPGLTLRRTVEDRPKWDETGYHAQQAQRRLERGIREAKALEAVAISPEAQRDARRLVKERQAKMRAHLSRHPFLKRQSAREQLLRATAA